MEEDDWDGGVLEVANTIKFLSGAKAHDRGDPNGVLRIPFQGKREGGRGSRGERDPSCPRPRGNQDCQV